jgi:hypothetical protein
MCVPSLPGSPDTSILVSYEIQKTECRHKNMNFNCNLFYVPHKLLPVFYFINGTLLSAQKVTSFVVTSVAYSVRCVTQLCWRYFD